MVHLLNPQNNAERVLLFKAMGIKCIHPTSHAYITFSSKIICQKVPPLPETGVRSANFQLSKEKNTYETPENLNRKTWEFPSSI
jgi:hypothetical protein